MVVEVWWWMLSTSVRAFGGSRTAAVVQSALEELHTDDAKDQEDEATEHLSSRKL